MENEVTEKFGFRFTKLKPKQEDEDKTPASGTSGKKFLLAFLILPLAIWGIIFLAGSQIHQSQPVNSDIKPMVVDSFPPVTESPSTLGAKTSTITDTDPIENCNFQYIGVKQLRRSVCAKSTECQLGSNWVYYDSVDKCKQDQQAMNNNSNQGLIDCYTTVGTFKVTPERCHALTYVDPNALKGWEELRQTVLHTYDSVYKSNDYTQQQLKDINNFSVDPNIGNNTSNQINQQTTDFTNKTQSDFKQPDPTPTPSTGFNGCIGTGSAVGTCP